MRRTNYYFPEPMLRELKTLAQRLDVPASELIRRALRGFLDQRQGDETTGEFLTRAAAQVPTKPAKRKVKA
jgi:metal-responsive CopG/Arc/MetJ family transcriptional regulator